MKHFSFFALLFFVHLNAQSQGYSIEGLNLEGDINTWYNSHFDSANIKPLTGPRPSLPRTGSGTYIFFVEDNPNWLQATLNYDGRIYTKIKLKYDILNQEVYVLHPLYLQPLSLNQGQVKYFDTPVGIFKPKNEDKGYSLILFEGDNLSFVKESSKKLIAKDGALSYKRYDDYFLISAGQKHQIRSAKSFAKLYPTHSKEIKKYMRNKESKSIKRNNKENYLAHIAAFCNNLSAL